MSAKAYQYAILRVVPRVGHEEFVNVGVILFSPELRFLGARICLDEQRLYALWPKVDMDLVRRHLLSIERMCAGEVEAGPMAAMSQSERFPLADVAEERDDPGVSGADGGFGGAGGDAGAACGGDGWGRNDIRDETRAELEIESTALTQSARSLPSFAK